MKVTEIVVKEQVRKDLALDATFVESIRSKGIIQPLVVYKDGSKTVLLVGHRRLAAAKVIGLKEVPVVYREVKDIHDLIETQSVENNARKALTSGEKLAAVAQAFGPEDLRQLTPEAGKVLAPTLRAKIQTLSAAYGLTPKAILAGALLIKAPKGIKAMMEKALLSEASAVLLSRLPLEKQEKFVDNYKNEKVVIEDSSVERWIEREASRSLAQAPFPTTACGGCPYNSGMSDLFGGKNTLGSCSNAPCWNKLKAAQTSKLEDELLAKGNKSNLPVVGKTDFGWDGKNVNPWKGKKVHTRLEGELVKLANESAGKKEKEASIGAVIVRRDKPVAIGYVILKADKVKSKKLKDEPAQQDSYNSPERIKQRAFQEFVRTKLMAEYDSRKWTMDEAEAALFSVFGDKGDEKKFDLKGFIMALIRRQVEHSLDELVALLGGTLKDRTAKFEAEFNVAYEKELATKAAPAQAPEAVAADEEDEDDA